MMQSYREPPAARSGGFHAIDVLEIVRILRRRASIIAASVAIVLACAVLFIAIVRPQFTGTATVLIDPRRTNVIDTGAILGNFGTDEASVESQVSLIQSLSVMQRVVGGMKLVEDPEFVPPPGAFDWIRSLFSSSDGSTNAQSVARAKAIDTLKRRLKVIRQRSTFLVDINASSVDPAKSAAIANAVAQAYFLEQVRSKYDSTKIAAGWLDNQINELKSRVIASDKAVQDFRAANNLHVAQGVTINDQQISDLNSKLITARAEAAEAGAKFRQLEHLAKAGGDPGAIAEALGSETIARLRAQYADLTKTDADLSTKFGARHPQLATVRAQLRETRRLIDEEVSRILDARRHNYEVAAAREGSLQKSLDELQNVSTGASQAQVRLRELQREAEANRTIYESFLARYREASAQETLEMPDSRIVTAADVPVTPSFPKTFLTLALGLLIGLGVGCVLALVADYLDRRIKTQGQAKASGLPSIATLPEITARELARLTKHGRGDLDRYDPRTVRLLPPGLQPPLLRYAVSEPMSAFAEAIRSIRFTIQQLARTRPTQLISITSATSGEGKTTLAANLAMSLAALGVKTALVEGDLRNPQISRSLCPNANAGLIDVALSEMPLHQALLTDPQTHLAILPAPTPRDVSLLSEFASSDSMNNVLTEMRKHFDVIIVDSPPLLPLIDGRALAELADTVILTVGWDHTPQELFMRAVELLEPIHDRILGTVLTRADLARLKLYDAGDGEAYSFNYLYQPSRLPEIAK
jgi:exopolysaccharide transport family protein